MDITKYVFVLACTQCYCACESFGTW